MYLHPFCLLSTSTLKKNPPELAIKEVWDEGFQQMQNKMISWTNSNPLTWTSLITTHTLHMSLTLPGADRAAYPVWGDQVHQFRWYGTNGHLNFYDNMDPNPVTLILKIAVQTFCVTLHSVVIHQHTVQQQYFQQVWSPRLRIQQCKTYGMDKHSLKF